MKFMIAGLGSIGRRHFRNLLALGEKDIVLYRSLQSTLPDDELEGYPLETDLEAALGHQPQAVIISNPTSLHLKVAIPAAKAGCSILMEKPISHTSIGLDQLVQALQHGGGKLLVGYQFRFHPTLRSAAAMIQDGTLGDVLSIKVHWGEYLPDWHPWEDYRSSYSARSDLGGGVVNTLSHPFDYLRWFFGDVENLQAAVSNNGLGLPVEDTANILMKFKSGTQANVHLNYLQRPPRHTLEIITSQGSLIWDNASGSSRYYNAQSKEWKEIRLPDGFERNQLFLAEMEHFLKVVRGEEEPLCTLEDGLAAVQITEAVHRAARELSLVELPH